jgi:hypothetical protein
MKAPLKKAQKGLVAKCFAEGRSPFFRRDQLMASKWIEGKKTEITLFSVVREQQPKVWQAIQALR